MFAPEYSISSEILKNISTVEYCRALIENTPILPHWQNQLQKEARVRFVRAALLSEGSSISEDTVKKEVDGFAKSQHQEIKNVVATLELKMELDDTEIKEIHKTLGGEGKYRSVTLRGGSDPEEILAEIVALFDWYGSLDARDTHPIIVAGIVFAQLEEIKPFKTLNTTVAMICAKMLLSESGYSLNDYLVFEDFFAENQRAHSAALDSAHEDLTEWLEYFTDVVSRKISNLKEKVLLLARDTKVAKATGRIDLTERQQRIVEFLQDYGLLQNKDFGRVFPDISEDTVLRDLKVLIDKDIVEKRGSTKSSRYELK